jgi:hypothetical protein
VDAFGYSSASLDKSSIASMVRKHQRAEELGALSLASATTATPQNKVQELLSSSMRPVWMDSKVAATGTSGQLEGMCLCCVMLGLIYRVQRVTPRSSAS